MSGQKEVGKLISKLGGQVATNNDLAHPLVGQVDITPYQVKGICPGDYRLVGHSFNVEYRIVGTHRESRRAGLIALLLEHKGDRRHCVTLQEALEYEGFVAILSATERDTLAKLPPETLIGPAYDKQGKCLRTAFAVWVSVATKKERPRLLVGVRGC